MDIPALSMAMAQSKTMSALGTEVLAMSLDHLEEAGATMVDMLNRSMMENSVYPHIGGNFDVTV